VSIWPFFALIVEAGESYAHPWPISSDDARAVDADAAAAGREAGRALAEHVPAWAADEGYAARQFNAVVETNSTAVRLWRGLGLCLVGTVPRRSTAVPTAGSVCMWCTAGATGHDPPGLIGTGRARPVLRRTGDSPLTTGEPSCVRPSPWASLTRPGPSAAITGGHMAVPLVPRTDGAWMISCAELRIPVDRASLDRRYSDWSYDRFHDAGAEADAASSPWPLDEVLRVTEPGHPDVHLMGLLSGGAGLLGIEVCEASSSSWTPVPYAVSNDVVWIAHVPARTMRVRITTTVGVKQRSWAALQATG